MKSVLFATVSVVVCAAAGAAQVSIDVGPLGGYYRPTGHYDPGLRDTKLPAEPSDLNGWAFGAEASIRFGRRLGIQAQAVEVVSTIPDVATPDGVDHGATSSREYIATAEAVYDVKVLPDARLWVGAGPARVHYGGDAYSPYGSPTQWAGALSAGSTFRIVGRLHGTVSISTVMYEINIPLPPFESHNPGSLERGFMKDVIVQAAMTWNVR